jgi:hypothetical protein
LLDTEHLLHRPLSRIKAPAHLDADLKVRLTDISAALADKISETSLSLVACHGDCHGGNTFIAANPDGTRRASFFDFDDSGPNYLAYDLAGQIDEAGDCRPPASPEAVRPNHRSRLDWCASDTSARSRRPDAATCAPCFGTGLCAAQSRAAGPLAEIHPPDLGQHAHCDHLCIPCSTIEQDVQSRGSILNERQQRSVP